MCIRDSDASVLLNNIPLRACGTPSIELAKTVLSDPERLEDGRQLVTYNFEITNTGETLVEDVRLDDDLSSVFGAGRVDIEALEITSAPDGFAGQENPAFNGETNIGLLSGPGDLSPGESLTVGLEVAVNPESCLLYTSPSPRDATLSRMPSSA